MGAGRKIALAAGTVMLACAVGLAAWLGLGYKEAAAPKASDSGTETVACGARFPDVDWAKWRKKCPDIIGWVSVPGTKVSYPVVQAKEDDPTFYLDHNSRGDWSVWGCPYLAADRADAGLLSSVPLVYGHHMNDGSMFSKLAEYTDKDWAKKHRKILVQTPEWRMVLKVKGARVANAAAETMPTGFDGMAGLQEWGAAELAKCSMRLGKAEVAANQMFVFCTCSYGTYANQRTLVYAVPESAEAVG